MHVGAEQFEALEGSGLFPTLLVLGFPELLNHGTNVLVAPQELPIMIQVNLVFDEKVSPIRRSVKGHVRSVHKYHVVRLRTEGFKLPIDLLGQRGTGL